MYIESKQKAKGITDLVLKRINDNETIDQKKELQKITEEKAK